MDTHVAPAHVRRARRTKRLPLVEETLGSRMFQAIWDGPVSKQRDALLERFGPHNCSNWARRIRRPCGDYRPKIEELTGIRADAWIVQAGKS